MMTLSEEDDTYIVFTPKIPKRKEDKEYLKLFSILFHLSIFMNSLSSYDKAFVKTSLKASFEKYQVLDQFELVNNLFAGTNTGVTNLVKFLLTHKKLQSVFIKLHDVYNDRY